MPMTLESASMSLGAFTNPDTALNGVCLNGKGFLQTWHPNRGDLRFAFRLSIELDNRC